MSLIPVTCPHCGHARPTPQEKIPPRPVRAICPVCAGAFLFRKHLEPALPFPPAAALAESPPAPSAPPLTPIGAAAPPEPPAAPRPAATPPIPSTPHFVFTGRAGEYFGIWIVNLLLKVVTLGFYSAWAKVRKRRYFYANTLLDGAPFDYTADPWAIFRGWCLGVLAFILYSVGSRVSPTLSFFFMVALFLAVPWIIVRARIFNARNSAHRNIRFTFRPDYREAYLVYGVLTILIPFTLGLIFPYMIYRQKKFQVENSGYGRTPFTFTAGAGDFYRLFSKVGLGLFVLLAILGGGAVLLAPELGKFSGNPAAWIALLPLMIVASVLFYLFVAVYVQTELTNLTWNATRLAGARLISTLRTRDMAWLYVSSAVAIVCSFGLLTPWAAVRLTRYRLERLAMTMDDGLRTLAAEQPEVGAAGEEFGDIFGIEVGLG
jgi:uncharacterized membrane protein YjgN (DUF898 family)